MQLISKLIGYLSGLLMQWSGKKWILFFIIFITLHQDEPQREGTIKRRGRERERERGEDGESDLSLKPLIFVMLR